MKIHGWAYAKNRTTLNSLLNKWGDKTESGKHLGSVYAVKFEVNKNVVLIKIGASSMPRERLIAFGDRGKLYCVSPACTNYFEIEGILHEHFARYRIPGRKNGVQPEYFNMSIPFFLSHLPELDFKME